MNDPWPRFKSFVFCAMIFVVFGTLMNWAQPLNGSVKGIDEPIGKLVFLLAIVSIALILLVQKLDLKWIARISVCISLCLFYYIVTITIRYDTTVSTIIEARRILAEGTYIVLLSSLLSIVIAYFSEKQNKDIKGP